MTPKQRRFVEEYLVDLNAKKAAVRAGYSAKHAAQIGWRLRRIPAVSQAIAEAMSAWAERHSIGPERVLHELSRIAFASISDFLEWGSDGVTLKDQALLDLDQQAAVSEIVMTRNAAGMTVRVKLHDKLGALKEMSRLLGLSAETFGTSRVVDAEYVELTDTERVQRVLALFERVRKAEEAEAASGGGDG